MYIKEGTLKYTSLYFSLFIYINDLVEWFRILYSVLVDIFSGREVSIFIGKFFDLAFNNYSISSPRYERKYKLSIYIYTVYILCIYMQIYMRDTFINLKTTCVIEWWMPGHWAIHSLHIERLFPMQHVLKNKIYLSAKFLCLFNSARIPTPF